jgi:hypothetical protein
MFRYRAFGLVIQSELPLDLPYDLSLDHTLTKATVTERSLQVPIAADAGGFPGSTGCIFIRRGRVEPEEDLPLILGSIRYSSRQGRIHVEVPWAGCYLVEDGRTVTVDAVSGASDGMVSTYVTGFLLQLILAANGALLLHGSAVGHRSRAFLFCGGQGAGKSTLAGALARRGCLVLCDDAVPLREGPLACPGITSLKLLPDAYNRLVGRPGEDLQPCDGDGKYRAELGIAFDPLPLSGVYILEPGAFESLSLESLRGMAKVQALLANANNLGGRESSPELFRKAVRILGDARVYRLRRPDRGDSLDALADLVMDRMERDLYVSIQ